jgi:crotonobetainyl-CoA:carnitine CoA-transferase CaiB-like acyl-CoA transferase
MPALADDPRFATNGDRVENRVELIATLHDRFAEQTSAEWLAALDAADVPAGPINDLPTAFASPQAVARRMAVDVEHPALGTTTQVGLPFELSATPASIRTAPPLLGEHSDEILTETGYSAGEIAALRRDGVI